MRYRGGGIGHTYMREIENRFEDMRLEQIGLEEAPQATQPPRGADDSVGESLASVAKAITSVGNTSMADSDDNDDDDGNNCTEGEDSGCEWVDIDDPGGNDSEDEVDDDDEISQGTYGMGEY